MDRELHGREAVLAPSGLVARLTGLTPYDFAGVRPEHGDDPPVTVLTGGRGMGKTALLKQIRNAYRRGTPLALLDCARVEEPAEHGPGWTPVTGALAELAVQLSPRVLSARPVRFPRLALGLAAAASISWSQEDDERVRRDLQRLGPVLSTVDESRGTAAAWVGKVLAKLAATVADGAAPLAGILAEATVESLLEDVFGRYQRRSESWYGAYRGAGGNGRLGLRRLAVDFSQGGTRRTDAEGFLVGTLVEDLRRAYVGPIRRGTRRGRPVVLLDNAHLPLGRHLLEPVLRDRADGRRDQVVFVAASRDRDHEGLRRATRLRLPEVAHRAPCPRGTDITSGVLAVELTPLSAAQTRSLFDRYDPDGRTPPELPGAVHRLTGGRPAGVALLGRAAGQAPAGVRGALTPGALLDLAVEVREDSPAVPVAATLLDELLPGLRPEEAAALTVLAAAHDEESARVLARTRLRAASADGDVVLRLRDALRADGWPAGTARPGGPRGTGAAPSHFVADPLLRALLLHRLRFHDGDAPAYAAWRAVHETLLAHCGPRPTPYRLRQELALGRADGAVTALREWFGDPDAGGWLDRLLLVASAPYPRVPHRAAPDPRRAVALGQDPGPVGELAGLDGATTALHQSVRRLLHAVWLLTDPLALPDEDVVERMAHELRQLSGRHLTGSLPLWDAATHWPRDIRARRAPTSPPGNEDGA
ncbi:hypothetical protein [Streptomyces somaliensis]|uniref:Uncharacterized protein n=1 Tax=Streptomyces somaliensis (strain ATCC 33201 / DSM 40738 / JCM 12659 / KCTC 9044 / NCTC 11332 / NRRL B-12077 / IP 733) TaxID=1134445 RepID=A0AA44DEI1_STRE0|nr:hypothetical protein [Streptomyces somaliensis]NKY14988.1 hypothetical protein [Streptomyces somaliensis DSM 40738]